jgi:hypothetical protein
MSSSSTDATIQGDMKETGSRKKKKGVPAPTPEPIPEDALESMESSTATSPPPDVLPEKQEEEGDNDDDVPFPGFPPFPSGNFDPSFFLNALSSLTGGGVGRGGRPGKKRRTRQQEEAEEGDGGEEKADDDDDYDDDDMEAEDGDDNEDEEIPLEAFLSYDGETLASISHRQAVALENIAESLAKLNKLVWKSISSS